MSSWPGRSGSWGLQGLLPCLGLCSQTLSCMSWRLVEALTLGGGGGAQGRASGPAAGGRPGVSGPRDSPAAGGQGRERRASHPGGSSSPAPQGLGPGGWPLAGWLRPTARRTASGYLCSDKSWRPLGTGVGSRDRTGTRGWGSEPSFPHLVLGKARAASQQREF